MFSHHLPLQQSREALTASGREFLLLFSHGTLEVELYKPDRVDRQQPHERDEVYLIASGQGGFLLEGARTEVKTGDFLFVPAGAEHRFVDFSDDFSTWVFFYGPKGGERGNVENVLTQ